MKIEVIKKSCADTLDVLYGKSLSEIKGGVAMEDAEVSCRRGYSALRCRCGYKGDSMSLSEE
ncbi:hypothetical protein [Marinifilum sp.]|uniref:hypothetical protein n=1 Tax=Marinifilum sp. TaxID=2033137 RepID=UPI003BABA983